MTKQPDYRYLKLATCFLIPSIIVFGLLIHYFNIRDELTTKPREATPDFAALTDVKQKKSTFFNFFRPLVAAQNKHIQTKRERLNKLLSEDDIGASDEAWLRKLAEDYRLDITDPLSQDDVQGLLERVDILPESLALSQAAIESAWGTSRFARQGNNFFGQWCFTKGCGLVPKARSAGASHEVQVFKTPTEAVQAYFANLNSHPAYQDVRRLRSQARQSGKPITGCELAKGLGSYSEKGTEYINEIRQMIRINRLSPHGRRNCQDLPVEKEGTRSA